MATNALFLLRDRIADNAALANFFQARYGKACGHFIGYKKTANANDFPSLCYVPVRTQKLNSGRQATQTVSVILGINEPGFDGGVFAGIEQSDIIMELIELSLFPQGLGGGEFIIDGQWQINTDLSIRHPFYETELQLKINRQTAPINRV